MWATQTWFLNDATETSHGLQVFLEVPGSYELSARPKHTRSWVNKWLHEAAGQSLWGWLGLALHRRPPDDEDPRRTRTWRTTRRASSHRLARQPPQNPT